MGKQSKTPRRRRHAAMRDVGGSDDHRERARSDRGVKSTDRSGSPPREPRHSLDNRAHPRHHRRDSTSHSRHDARHRDREAPKHPSTEHSRRSNEKEDLIPRFRASKAAAAEPDDGAVLRSRSRERAGPGSPYSAKRHRSRSHSPNSSQRKRSKRPPTPPGRERDRTQESDSRKRRRHSSHDRRNKSPRRHSRSRRDRSPNHLEDVPSRSKQRARSRSPTGSEFGPRGPPQESRPPKGDTSNRPSRSHSRTSERRHQSPRRLNSSPRASHSGPPPHTALDGRRGDEFDRRHSYRGQPPRSPRAHRDRARRDDSVDPHYSSRSEVDDDMASRSSFRGGYNPLYPPKPHFGNDPRGYSQSPHHAEPYHDPATMSPYGAGRAGWNAQQYSPPHQYPPQYAHGSGSYGPQNGDSRPYHGSASHSPPYAAPSGPMHPFAQAPYRGGGRGNGFRGAPFPNRGGHRGSNFKSAQWNSANQGPHSRGQQYTPDEANSRRQSLSSAPNEGNDSAAEDMDLDGNPRQPSKDTQGEDTSHEEKQEDDAAVTPSRPPPPSDTGSQPATGAKFSFAFKTSSKPTPAAPKPEISQKFNAAPQKRDAPATDNSSRDPPRSAPTEPASARARPDLRNAPDGPKVVPRMRKVKTTMRRPKPRPCLSVDLVESESVFFRKPGNESVVGSGTYGKVFKGVNVYTKGLVALKRIRMEGERDGFPVTAIREIKLLQSLKHTNIVKLQEVMVEKNDCFMVFEYLSHDLTGLLNHPSFKLDPAQRKHLAKQLFEGLDYLHTRGVLHRDIKAANILVSNEGILKLADFGLARFYAKRHQLDYTNRVITIWYRSPELLLGETKYTAAVDVWSAACVMVEIFTKTPIFAGDGTELSQLDKIYGILGTPSRQEWPGLVDMAWFELLRPQAKRRSVFAEKYGERLTPAAFELLEMMLCYNPANRPTAAEALQHRYFTTEEPLAKQAIELSNIDGDWHEFESKALRKENERRDREARRAKDSSRVKDKKRANDANDREREAKRANVEA